MRRTWGLAQGVPPIAPRSRGPRFRDRPTQRRAKPARRPPDSWITRAAPPQSGGGPPTRAPRTEGPSHADPTTRPGRILPPPGGCRARPRPAGGGPGRYVLLRDRVRLAADATGPPVLAQLRHLRQGDG